MDFRAYDVNTQWRGDIRSKAQDAQTDATKRNESESKKGGFGATIVIQRYSADTTRAVDLSGAPVWPPHGRELGMTLFDG